jgi:hypothetical protein
MHENFNFSSVGIDQSAKPTDQVDLADYLSTVAKSTRLTALVGQADSPVSLTDPLVANPVTSLKKLPNRPNITSSDVGVDLEDWRTPLLRYLHDRNIKIDKSVRRSAFKYVMHNDELNRRTVEDLLLKCLGSDQAIVAMGEVHEGICGTHQSAPKMKWLLCRAGFYWPTMMADCFRYYKGCQKFGNIQLVPAAMLYPIINP